MMVSNQVSLSQIYPFLRDEPPFLWTVPWNHTFGGNYNLNMVLHNGGTMYIDEGALCPAASRRRLRTCAKFHRRSI